MSAFYLHGYFGDGFYLPEVSAGTDPIWGTCLIIHGQPVESAYIDDDGRRVVEDEAAPEPFIVRFKYAEALPDMWTPSWG